MKLLSKIGFIFEHEVAEKFKEQGFTHVKVTKASRDYGADILAFKDGLEYVVQCKKYKGVVGYKGVKDVSAAMDIYQADRGILVCDISFSKPTYEAVNKIEKPIELITLQEIKTWKAKEVKPIKYKPFSYQKNILSKLIKHRKQGNTSALLVMATGLGKTLVAAWDLKNQIKKGEKALFLVHRKDILVDNAEKFHAIINKGREKFKFGIYFAGKKFKKEDIIFSTFQTVIKHYSKIPQNYFNYIIIDEAHHSPAPTYSKIFSYFNPKFILGITATPKRITKADNDFINTVFGKPLVDLDLAEALIREYLSPVQYSVFCDNIDYESLRTVNRKLSIEQLNQSYFIPTKDEDIEKIIYDETKKIKSPKTIIFCPTIKYINSVKSIGLFKNAEIYHSNMSDFDRGIIFRRFKIGKIKTILVVDLFNEGIDIPDANIVVFLRTTYSPTIFFQQLGRGLRRTPGKKYLRVLDFVGALSKVKKVINAFGHLLIIQDFAEKVERQKKLSNVYRGKIYKASGLLEPLELDFFQAGRKVKHRETLFKKKNFLSEVKFIKKHLIKAEGWTEEEIINELKPICKKLGYFPSREYLIKMGRVDLTVQIGRRGGVYYFGRKMGYIVRTKQKGYWNNWENMKKELFPICKKLGKMPTQEYFRKIKQYDLLGAIDKWGGINRVAEKLGYQIGQKPKRYWDNWANLKKELLPICKKLGKMPTGDYLRKIEREDLEVAIYKWGGIYRVAKKLNYETSQKSKGYWLNWRNLKRELLPICKGIGRMPTGEYLTKIKRADLNNAINKLWGGNKKVAEKLGYRPSRQPVGHWDTWENLRKELLPICKRLGKIPTQKYLVRIKKGGLNWVVNKWGGFNKVAKKLGFKTSQKPKNYWDNWGNLKKELIPICKKFNRMPSRVDIRKIGKAYLEGAINKWGGINKVSEKLGYKMRRKSEGYWEKWENLKRELMPICKKIKGMPTAIYLNKTGRNDLSIAIYRKWGGFNNVEKRLKLEL